MRHAKVKKRTIDADNMYGSLILAKFINNIMLNGKKSIAQKKVYNALALIEKDGKDPLQTFEKAVSNVSPKVEVRARRIGGANYQVPTEVRAERKTALALRWIIESARKRTNKEYHTFEEKLAAELLAAANNEGEAMKKKEIMHKQAEANRAFSHFRW